MAIECNHGRLARKCELCELEEALARISALEAERDKALELLKRWESVYGKCSALSDDTRAFLASIGGEEQP